MCGFSLLLQQDVSIDCLPTLFATKPRGPERSKVIMLKDAMIVFHRLSIMNKSHLMDQPFVYEHNQHTFIVVCNGEIYNYKQLIQELHLEEHNIQNDTDVIYYVWKACEFNTTALAQKLNGEYALSIIELDEQDQLVQCFMMTDMCSVRPLFYAIDGDSVSVSSLLAGIVTKTTTKTKIKRLNGGEYVHLTFANSTSSSTSTSTLKIQTMKLTQTNVFRFNTYTHETNELYKLIVDTFTQSVQRRLQSDRPLGCLLSGGLDSSLVAAIAAKELAKQGQRLKTFTIGMTGGTDLEFARSVANHIGSDHTEILFTEEEGLSVIEDVVRCCESFDITTVRASVGQHLIAKYISKHTDLKVVLNGDGSDEAWMGYLYFHLAPSAEEAQKDSLRLLENIHYFDGLRVDRNISHWGLEARLPFLDTQMVQVSQSISGDLRLPTFEPSLNARIEKYILRKAFDVVLPNLLPSSVLWRVKEAFSDGVSTQSKSWYQIVKEHALKKNISVEPRTHLSPVSAESAWFRKVFEETFGTECCHIIPYYWLPSWTTSTEPSARVLSVYQP